MNDDRLTTDALAYMRKVLATYRAVPAMEIDTRTLILLLDEFDAARARVAALEAALRDASRTVTKLAIEYDDDWHRCTCCGAVLPVTDEDHEPDCSYVVARKWLKELDA